MALLSVHFNFFYGMDNECILKELAFPDSQMNRVSSFLFKSSHTLSELASFRTLRNSEPEHDTNRKDR
jgi:hypothetical protein